jgi:hypothetical protein
MIVLKPISRISELVCTVLIHSESNLTETVLIFLSKSGPLFVYLNIANLWFGMP